MQIEISANSRKLHGTGANRRLRSQGRLPGVIYGGNGDAQSIELDHKDLYYKLKMEAFHASILSISIDGKKEQVLLRDVQMHPFKQQVLHIDFQRVRQDQKIHVKVPLHFINADIAPGVKLSGGMISHVATEIEISCLPKDLPEFITVDLSGMTAGSTLHLSDLILSENVEIPALLKGDNLPVATLIAKRGEAGESSEE
ncbi:MULTISPECIES: 50S ribosomal protein L25/general stress protein Ctc [Nitrosomonas]|uniref:Large ribosomal subunit protein bL25 n=2 Tax=Nitrosomonas europaea TaxID=915 RepID=RL25_NITEU|nr:MULTISPECIES: 50S ribosomal protein L25/general stress protein Ctc [Nitrosomonas]Q82TQ5.1 RecName: Full=Large ribosomal subunit protein bL25; AltName: Full=50S ribosomal protein L25; AltName: Full=General stress protein CTC [Nitrosomonas europaea ATCC 19718]KXK44004.1 MAG: 50S ribosomal protein L25/general stress protein Ctc [Nitrosomonas europaea]MBV6389571.1 50S ribosomal protein L25 [Nitrosomonas europaea]MEB2331076.1 50S ribosomal protein L25/general stress protein Ctc [Nitrosomonas sp.]